MAFDPIIEIKFHKSANWCGLVWLSVGAILFIIYGQEDSDEKWAKCPKKVEELLLVSIM